jgi:HAD superfamily hydrolase (TIGR01484 family)
MKKVIVFDLDGTLAASKQSLDSETSDLLYDLLYVKNVGIVSGGGFAQFQKQVLDKIKFDKDRFKNLFIFPTKGAMMYVFDGKDWKQTYQKLLSDEQKEKIKNAFEKVIKEVDFLPKKTYGKILEDRKTQFTFSALGQDAPFELKKVWDVDLIKRKKMRDLLINYLPEFEVEIGGSTSIDITEKNVDKAYALEQLCKYEHIGIDEILYIGDALFPGGNDSSVLKTGVDTIRVKDYNETKDVIRKIIAGKI